MRAAAGAVMNPLVTIAIPTLRRLAYLQEAVASALAQQYQPLEVLIGDDGNKAAVRTWCEQQAAADSRVRYQRNTNTLGIAGNWNALAAAARGEFLTIIGDDDRLLPEFVSRLVPPAVEGAAVVFCNHHLIDEHGSRLERETQDLTKRYGRAELPEGRVDDAEACVWRNAVPISAALLRTAKVRKLRFKEDLNTPEIELFLRLAREDGGFVFVPDFLAEYRTHSQSATSGGLWSERLAEYLLALPASPSAEPHKRRFMGPLLVDAVTRCLLQGDPQRARRFLRNKYYPKPVWRHGRGAIHGLCANLPALAGCGLFRLLWRVRHRWGRR